MNRTTTLTEMLHDTAIIVQQDSSLLRLLLECDSLGNVHIKNLLDWQAGQHLKPPKQSIDDNNVLTTECEVDSFAIYAKLRDIYQHDETVMTKFEYVPYPLTWWQQTQIHLGNMMLILLAGVFVALIIKGIKLYCKPF